MKYPSMNLVHLILALLVLIILIGLFYGFFNIFHKGLDARTCRASVDAHIAAHVQGLDPYEDLKCPPQFIKIDKTLPEEIKRKTADLMAECYWKFGENQELFGEDGIYCAVCSHIAYTKSDDTIEDFDKFLIKEFVPEKYAEHQTYATYVIGEATDPDEVKVTGLPDKIILDTDKDYGVMFVYAKNRHLSKLLSAFARGNLAADVVLAAGLYLFPPSSLASLGFKAICLVSAGSGVMGAISGYESGKSPDWQAAVLLVPWNEKELSKLPCTTMPVRQDNK